MSNSRENLQSLVESIKPRSNDPLLEGRKVTVRRSNSQLEEGFTITFFDKENGQYVVQKDKNVEKVSIQELEKLNPPRQNK